MRNRLKFGGLLLGFIILTAMNAMNSQAQVTLDVGSDAAVCGQTMEIPITANNATNIDAFTFTFTFNDTNLEYISTAAGAATADWANVAGNLTNPGEVTILGFAGLGTPVNGNGVIAVVTLRCDVCPSANNLSLMNLLDDVAGAVVNDGTATCDLPPPPSLDVGSDAAVCGDTLMIPITINDANNVDAFTFTFTFDDLNLEYISTVAGAATIDWANVAGNLTNPGEVTILGFAGLGTPVNGNGVIAVVTLRCDVCPSSSNLSLMNLLDDVAGAMVTDGTADCNDVPPPTPTPPPDDNGFGGSIQASPAPHGVVRPRRPEQFLV